MAIFILDVFDNGKKAATLDIQMLHGTQSNGFIWNWVGMGMQTGGNWEWNFVGKFFISLVNKDGYFGHVHASWNRTPTKTGFPPLPWFSLLQLSVGTVELQGLGFKTFNWALK